MNLKPYQFACKVALGVVFLVGCGYHFRSYALNSATSSGQILKQSTAYFCDKKSANPILVGRSELGNVPIIVFRKQMADLTPLKRCQEIAQRFNNLTFTYLGSRRNKDGQKVIFATRYEGELLHSHENEVILLTLNSNENSVVVLEKLKGVLSSFGDHQVIDH